jgi:hypothetical protein
MEPMKHDDAPDAPDRAIAIKWHTTAMPQEVPTSVKGPAQARTVRDTRAPNTKPSGVVGDPLALLRDPRSFNPSTPVGQNSSTGRTFDVIHDRSFSPASVLHFVLQLSPRPAATASLITMTKHLHVPYRKNDLCTRQILPGVRLPPPHTTPHHHHHHHHHHELSYIMRLLSTTPKPALPPTRRWHRVQHSLTQHQ